MTQNVDKLLDGVMARHRPSPSVMAQVHQSVLEADVPVDVMAYGASISAIFEKAFWGLNHLNEFLSYVG